MEPDQLKKDIWLEHPGAWLEPPGAIFRVPISCGNQVLDKEILPELQEHVAFIFLYNFLNTVANKANDAHIISEYT
jgi:hypothetical protein